ncbi:divergent PAP2 family protein [Virgibacillus sp. FSP13]
MPYFLAPFVGWLASGCLKYLINKFKYGENARQYVGNGGFPSTHTSTVSSTVFLIGFGEGWFTPVFGLAVAFLFIVIIDATGLRMAVGKQATVVNQMNTETADYQPLRESMGHTLFEILGGLVVGFITSGALFMLFSWWGWL